MEQNQFISWLTCILGGFILGSIMFSQWIPRIFLHKNITQLSPDHNPGATNVFLICGPVWGILCLSLDFLKGFLPALIAYRLLDPENAWFALAMAAPVMGHALAPFNHFRGGKCIATAFGVLLGLFPLTHIVLVLAAIYIIFSTMVKINPNRLRSIAAFGLFGVISFLILTREHQESIALGCLLISVIAIWKHSKYFMMESCTPAP